MKKPEPASLERGWEAHRRGQARIGLRLTPRERLEWLERTLEEMRRLLGRARHQQ